MPANDPLTAYVGTFTEPGTDGIYRFDVGETGALTEASSVDAGDSPSFLANHPTLDRLYAVNTADAGEVRSFAIDESGDLEPLNVVETGRAGPCYGSVDSGGDVLLAAHYFGGCVSATPIDDDGRLVDDVQVIDHEGSSVNPDRQTEPHPHSIVPGWNDEVAYAADLGTDEVVIYDLDGENAQLEYRESVPVHDGAGPRHFAFHPSGDYVYLINELDNTIVTFQCHDDGGLSTVDTVETLPADFDGESYTAHVATHPSGEYLYGSNRGHDSISVFDLSDPAAPEAIQHVSTGGEWPRHFALSPDGSRLYAENRDTDDIVRFDVDGDTGELSATGDRTSVAEPVCLLFQ